MQVLKRITFTKHIGESHQALIKTFTKDFSKISPKRIKRRNWSPSTLRCHLAHHNPTLIPDSHTYKPSQNLKRGERERGE